MHSISIATGSLNHLRPEDDFVLVPVVIQTFIPPTPYLPISMRFLVPLARRLPPTLDHRGTDTTL